VGLSELEWRVVCCSDHLTATLVLSDEYVLNVQKLDSGYSITMLKDGKFAGRKIQLSQLDAELYLAELRARYY
jgi:hypothetical protein